MADKQDALRMALEALRTCAYDSRFEEYSFDEELVTKALTTLSAKMDTAQPADAQSASTGELRDGRSMFQEDLKRITTPFMADLLGMDAPAAQPAKVARCAHCGHMHATEECAWNHLRYNHPVADQQEDKPVLKSIKCAACGIDFNSDDECRGDGRCALPGFEPPAAPQPPKPAAQNNQEPTK